MHWREDRPATAAAASTVLDKLDACLAATITHVICDATGPDYELASLRKHIEWRDWQTNRSL